MGCSYPQKNKISDQPGERVSTITEGNWQKMGEGGKRYFGERRVKGENSENGKDTRFWVNKLKGGNDRILVQGWYVEKCSTLGIKWLKQTGGGLPTKQKRLLGGFVGKRVGVCGIIVCLSRANSKEIPPS